MRLVRDKRKRPSDTPERPSHFNQDVNEVAPRDHTEVDYATTEDKVVSANGFPPVAEPTAVFLTEAPPRERTLRRGSLDTFTLDSSVDRLQQIAGNDRNRVRLYIVNIDATNSAFLRTEGMNKSQTYAFELPKGVAVEMFHNSAVWAFCATATVKLSVLQEYEVEDL